MNTCARRSDRYDLVLQDYVKWAACEISDDKKWAREVRKYCKFHSKSHRFKIDYREWVTSGEYLSELYKQFYSVY